VDLVDKYPQFYWEKVSPYISDAIRYLNVTASAAKVTSMVCSTLW
jgi:hypothetical protein